MEIRVGLENGYEGRTLAWALDYPGCFAYGSNEAEALENIAAEFLRYRDWISSHTQESWLAGIDLPEVRLTEVWEVYRLDSEYRRVESGGKTINAWFSADWLPLTRQDIERGLQLLAFSRRDLLAAVQGISSEELDRARPGERWSLRGILGHVANAEWWYLDRLNLSGIPREELPVDVFARLEAVRARLVETLPQLEGAERAMGKMGEWWSPRKVLRRAVEHELDHVGHIRKLLE